MCMRTIPNTRWAADALKTQALKTAPRMTLVGHPATDGPMCCTSECFPAAFKPPPR